MAKVKPHAIARPIPKLTRPRWDYWRGIVEECRRSGLGQGEFCRRRGIPPGTLSCWKHKLAHERAPAVRLSTSGASRPAERPAFLPVRITRGPASRLTPALPAAADVEIEVTLGLARAVRVRGRVDTRWLRQAIQALGALGC